ncbi:NfeD family protein [Belnapia sp. T18]|uniref:NfeD family protein n=1 Tax=Belnapia arida TaxID=2804533 RepID=A0ABS1U6U6_9PROT|nr:NfeD family protein [Belnapia arida]MBL6079417.1 NfeD family protein [Belnapia arida]
MEPGLIWILAGLLLLLAELAIPGVFLVWIGLAALGTGALQLLAVLSFGMVVTVFLVLLGAGIWLSLRLRRAAPPAALNTPGSGLVGRSGMLLPLGEAEGPGLRVRIGDSEWQARLPLEIRAPERPLRVRVEAVEGTTLIVRPE